MRHQPSHLSQVYTVEKLIKVRKRKNQLEYFVQWKDWGPEHNTWEPESHILDKNLIHEFHKCHETHEYPSQSPETTSSQSSSLPQSGTWNVRLKASPCSSTSSQNAGRIRIRIHKAPASAPVDEEHEVENGRREETLTGTSIIPALSSVANPPVIQLKETEDPSTALQQLRPLQLRDENGGCVEKKRKDKKKKKKKKRKTAERSPCPTHRHHRRHHHHKRVTNQPTLIPDPVVNPFPGQVLTLTDVTARGLCVTVLEVDPAELISPRPPAFIPLSSGPEVPEKRARWSAPPPLSPPTKTPPQNKRPHSMSTFAVHMLVSPSNLISPPRCEPSSQVQIVDGSDEPLDLSLPSSRRCRL